MNAAWLKIKTTEFQAARLAFLGDRVKAPELLRLGLISEYVSDDSVVERCNEIAATIAGYPTGAAEAIKQSLVAQRGIDKPEDFFPKTANSALNSAKMLKD
jgi:enoyl-CoA hydratase/carnithine racemase